MITKDELADKITMAFAERITPPESNADREALAMMLATCAGIAADVADAAFALDPDAPQTVTLQFKVDVLPGEVGTLLSAATHAMQQASCVTDEGVERAAEHAWDAHCEVHKSAKAWADARETDRAMFRVVARAALETRQVPL